MSTVTSTLPVAAAPARAAKAPSADPAQFDAEFESALAALPDSTATDARTPDAQAADSPGAGAQATDTQAADTQGTDTQGTDATAAGAPVTPGSADGATAGEVPALGGETVPSTLLDLIATVPAGIPVDPATPGVPTPGGQATGDVDTPGHLGAAEPATEADDTPVDLPEDPALPGDPPVDVVADAVSPTFLVVAAAPLPGAAVGAESAGITSAPTAVPSVPAGAAAPAPVAPAPDGSARVLDSATPAPAATALTAQPESAPSGRTAAPGTAAAPVAPSTPATSSGAAAAAGGVPGSEPAAPAAPTASAIDAQPSTPLLPVAGGASAVTAPVATEGSPAARVDVASLAAQIGRPLHALRTAGDGTHVLTISVTPDNLGPVQVRAHVSGESLRIELIAPTDQAREALKSILGDLRRDLSFGGGQATLDLSSGNEPSGRDAAPGESGGRAPARETTAPAAIDPRRPLRTDSVLDVLA